MIKEANPSNVSPGGEVTFTIQWEVKGNDRLNEVVISDVLPQGMWHVSGGENGPDGVIRWYLGTLNPPASGVVRMQAQVSLGATPGGCLVNTVRIQDRDGHRDRDEARVCMPPPEIPEAQTIWLLGSGLASWAGYFTWRRRRQP